MYIAISSGSRQVDFMRRVRPHCRLDAALHGSPYVHQRIAASSMQPAHACAARETGSSLARVPLLRHRFERCGGWRAGCRAKRRHTSAEPAAQARPPLGNLSACRARTGLLLATVIFSCIACVATTHVAPVSARPLVRRQPMWTNPLLFPWHSDSRLFLSMSAFQTLKREGMHLAAVYVPVLLETSSRTASSGVCSRSLSTRAVRHRATLLRHSTGSSGAMCACSASPSRPRRGARRVRRNPSNSSRTRGEAATSTST